MIESVYIHIPFCQTICHYCDFTKLLYQKKWIVVYLKALEQEIKKYHIQNPLKTIYIGGGTPSALEENEFLYLLQLVHNLPKQKVYEYTIECNIESLSEEKIKYMKQYDVNRISIGIESFHSHHLQNINRNHTFEQVKDKINLLKQYGFTNINLDLIYALPDETLEEVKEDIKLFLELDINHISTYSLMIEPNTIFSIQNQKPILEELDLQMYQTICQILEKNGYIHYEISNFSKPGYASKHNLTYWDNNQYYGFGLGASGYIKNIRYTNTKSLNQYCKGEFISEQEEISLQMDMENELILGFRKKEGVSITKFYQKYKKNIETIFPIEKLKQKGQLCNYNGFIQIPEEKWYISNEILVQLLSDNYDSNNQ